MINQVKIIGSLPITGSEEFCREVEVDINGLIYPIKCAVSRTKANQMSLDPDNIYTQLDADNFYKRAFISTTYPGGMYPFIENMLVSNLAQPNPEVMFTPGVYSPTIGKYMQPNALFPRVCFLSCQQSYVIETSATSIRYLDGAKMFVSKRDAVIFASWRDANIFMQDAMKIPAYIAGHYTMEISKV